MEETCRMLQATMAHRQTVACSTKPPASSAARRLSFSSGKLCQALLKDVQAFVHLCCVDVERRQKANGLSGACAGMGWVGGWVGHLPRRRKRKSDRWRPQAGQRQGVPAEDAPPISAPR